MNTLNRFKIKPIKEFIPSWNRPSDPAKTLLWFLHWFLRALVHYFWLPLGVMCIYELVANWMAGGVWSGVVSALVTLVIGMFVWVILYAVTMAANLAGRISQAFTEVSQLQQQMPRMYGFDEDMFNTSDPFGRVQQQQQEPPRTRVVEGTITDLDEERRKRRYE